MKLLLGVYGMQEADAREFVKMANEMGADIKSYALRIGKIAVERYLQENKDTSVVIVSEALEAKSPYEVGDFERIIDIKNDLTIIPILNNETEGTEKILGIFNLGIYNAIYAKDAMGENVARLIVDPRSRKLAKSYYRIQDAMENTNGANIEQCVEYILSGEKDELPERAVYIKERVSKTDFLTIKSMLPYEIQEVIDQSIPLNRGVLSEASDFPKNEEKDIENDNNISGKNDERKEEVGGRFSAIESLMKKTQGKIAGIVKKQDIDEPEEDKKEAEPEYSGSKNISISTGVDLSDVLSNVQIAFVGVQKRCGVTHQAIIAAEYLAAYGYRVAFVDCSQTKGKSLNAIAKYQSVKWKENFFSYCNVDYYPDAISRVQDILTPHEYHFVVMDFGPYAGNIKDMIEQCQKRFVVAGSAPWEQGQLQSFMKEVSKLDGDFVYLIRGVSDRERSDPKWENLGGACKFAENQDNPFSGECYESLKNELSVYTTGKNQKKEKKQNRKRVDDNPGRERKNHIGTAAVFVTSLKHGCGCSHFSSGIANYLNMEGYDSCVITKSPDAIESEVDEGIELVRIESDYESSYGRNQYVIIDGGVYSDLKSEQIADLKRAQYKVMMCWGDDEYLRLLATFVKNLSDEETAEWIFVFNNVTGRKIREMKNLMNGMFSCYLPMYDTLEMPREVRKIMKEILLL